MPGQSEGPKTLTSHAAPAHAEGPITCGGSCGGTSPPTSRRRGPGISNLNNATSRLLARNHHRVILRSHAAGQKTPEVNGSVGQRLRTASHT